MRKNKTERLGLKELIAIGVGGMVGGGIFSVLGLSVSLSGHASPVAFTIGGIIALFTGLSYARLGIRFRGDGGSFTYLEKAFKNENVAGIGGWLLLTGYIGTLALYAYTFGVYGTAMLGEKAFTSATHHILESFILLIFLGVNLYGVQAAGETEDIIVMIKVLILGLFAAAGLVFIKPSGLLPIFNKGTSGTLIGAALIFVAYEGFELIPNAVNEMKNPERDLGRAIVTAVVITAVIYFIVSMVAVGNLSPNDIGRYKEYALAVAARPFLGTAGFTLIGVGALLSTASAINATLFGTARLGMVMAKERELPKVFSHRERTKDIPFISLITITILSLIFVNTTDLTIISSFASSTFLLIFVGINLAAIKLRKEVNMNPFIPFMGMLMSAVSWVILVIYLTRTNFRSLSWICGFYLAIAAAEIVFSKRSLFLKRDS